MTNLANKEKNLNDLLEKLSNLSNSYSQDGSGPENLKKERDSVLAEKNLIEKRHNELLMEYKHLKDKIFKLEQELNKKTQLQDKFNREIDELSQETEELVEEIDKWQM
jgi:peptidoglycan hydrolase CwlO-like protein